MGDIPVPGFQPFPCPAHPSECPGAGPCLSLLGEKLPHGACAALAQWLLLLMESPGCSAGGNISDLWKGGM